MTYSTDVHAEGLTLVTPPTAEPISVSEAKAHLRVSHSAEDSYISGLITMARNVVEAVTNRALVTQTWKAFYPWLGTLVLPWPKLQSVTHVKYTDYAGTQTAIGATVYSAVSVSEPGRIHLAYGQQWPTFTAGPGFPIEVQFVCGYGAASVVPVPLKQAMFLLIQRMYEHRGEATTFVNVNFDQLRIEFAHNRLLDNYVVHGTLRPAA